MEGEFAFSCSIAANTLSIDFAAVADADNEDANKLIFNAGDDAVVANAILPKVAKFGAFQRFANAAGIVEQ